MPITVDRTGIRYGRLVALERAGRSDKGHILWRCMCDCGKEKIVSSSNLSSKKSKSCGCLKVEFLAKKGNQWALHEDRELAILKVQYSHLNRRNSKFTGDTMPYADFERKSRSACHYCGVESSKVLTDTFAERKDGKRMSDTILHINGIDRIDSSIGYTSINTLPCCKNCNFAKNIMSIEEFLAWISRVYNHSISK